MEHKRRAKCLQTEKQNRDNTVSENISKGERINVLTMRCMPGKREWYELNERTSSCPWTGFV